MKLQRKIIDDLSIAMKISASNLLENYFKSCESFDTEIIKVKCKKNFLSSLKNWIQREKRAKK